MKVVIDIPEDFYTVCKEWVVDECANIEQAIIAEGTPLPKGHGRLIDADAYIEKTGECDWLDDISVDEFNKITPTIIEADKGD